MVNRIAHRLLIKEETVWARLRELRAHRAGSVSDRNGVREENEAEAAPPEPKSAPAPRHELELLELLLAEPSLVRLAQVEVPLEELENHGLRKVVEALYRLQAEGLPADLDHLHERLDNERIWDRVQDLQQRGLEYPDRPHVFQKVLERFRQRRTERSKQAIKNQMQDADPATSLELLRQLKNHK
jgi:DNA primase